MIFIDSNIPMYLIGSPHPHKDAARRLLENAVRANERLVTDVEVFQEILHRYSAINRREAIQPAFDIVRELADEVFSIDMPAVEQAKSILMAHSEISARDALHIAIMRSRSIERIMSFDNGFDRVMGLTRIH